MEKVPENPRPKYTLEDLKIEKDRLNNSGGPNNLRAHERFESQVLQRIQEIEEYLIETGVMPKPPEKEKTEEEAIKEELDRLYPNAKSKTIVEYGGKKYQIKYYPGQYSNSGKTVVSWGHYWSELN